MLNLKVKNFIILSIISIILSFSMLVLIDIDGYNQIEKGNYKTPWYSSNIFVQPYTHFKLSGLPHTIKIEKTDNRMWVLEETVIGSKTYWTIIEEKEI